MLRSRCAQSAIGRRADSRRYPRKPDSRQLLDSRQLMESHFVFHVASVQGRNRLEEHDPTLVFRDWAVFHSARHYDEFAFLDPLVWSLNSMRKRPLTTRNISSS